ncbi:MAG: hypothetical protein M2R45_00381 [Verrucomicrobia subdivision 3 bacterium]|nr:hypothetical protein [Limisphaerales bacterium]MCS1412860.1 hypothetical protein [Limisphaerales bacterium]
MLYSASLKPFIQGMPLRVTIIGSSSHLPLNGMRHSDSSFLAFFCVDFQAKQPPFHRQGATLFLLFLAEASSAFLGGGEFIIELRA